MLTHTLGFPRIGADRELKQALEAFWRGKTTENQLRGTAGELRHRHWRLQKDRGVDLVPVGDFSFYDQVLDTTAMLGAVPPRFGWDGERVDLTTYFRMARGEGDLPAMEMSKWFNTNYHYIVPEFHKGQTFGLASTQLLEQTDEAIQAGLEVKPVLLGPLTWIKLGKSTEAGFNPLDHLDKILPVYEQVIQALSKKVKWIQIDEPALVLDLNAEEQRAFRRAHERLGRAAGGARILLATYFGPLGDNAELACRSGAGALHIDLATAPRQLEDVLRWIGDDQTLSLGLVNGRNIWRVDADAALEQINCAARKLGKERVMLGTSCSLQHVPVDLELEPQLDPEVRSWLAFATQKCDELRLLADGARGNTSPALRANRDAWASRRQSRRVHDPAVSARVASITGSMANRQSAHPDRKASQQARLNLPPLPTTTIGSFPQTAEIRRTRREFRSGQLDAQRYTHAMRGFIREAVVRQLELGLDVLVHGEPERNDMVEYFGEQLNGFAFTQNGWVQSYGSRCVKPPILFGDVSRPRPMTVEWTRYAQLMTDKPMKGMLTGPVTILCWSFVRDDQPLEDTCRQIALAIRDEVQDLESTGTAIIQVDEAALREGLPLRRADWNEYLAWAVHCFKIATSGVRDDTQIHTHMCYSEFNDIIDWIAKMDADVISIEASRSRMELLQAFGKFDYPNDIGPGIYDIHSPRVPSVGEMEALLTEALRVIPAERLWINPDCGLKTRGWPETLRSLRNMMAVVQPMREKLLIER